MTAVLLIAAAFAFLLLLYIGRAYWAWVSAAAIFLIAWGISASPTSSPVLFTAVLVAVAAAIFGIPAIRRPLLSTHLMRVARESMPRMSDSERIAIAAGTVWWDGDLFSGRPDWRKLLDFKSRRLSEREQAFLEEPVDELCRLIDDWQISQDRRLPQEVWDFLKNQRFFGMIIPQEYGGLGFSAIAHSAVVTKVASRSIPVACTLMVPNSLGPAELLLHYGTQEQRDYYLPRLASGQDIPCFALTEPYAGSDAASARSSGIVCRGMFEGREVIGLRLTLNKRYITLAPVATVIGLAFDMRDPDGLLGETKHIGMTCALVPRNTKGIIIGEHHDPLGLAFPNGPISGFDVFVPLECIIGGRNGAGQGWRMLMECLAAGRSISLPALSVAAVEMAARITGAYASIREQFNMPIGRFEGIEEPLARISGHTYLMNAARVLTCGAVDAGEKPAIVSAVVKAYLTDSMRACIADAMDIVAGAGICRGPRNLLSRIHVAAPIAITVEGANILTRSLIIFGQGALRCHPFIQKEISAIEKSDLVEFDRHFFKHLAFTSSNALRSFWFALVEAWPAPASAGSALSAYCRKISRFSAAFALIADATLATLGSSFKRQEKISGRLSDALAWMYLASAAIKRFHDTGRPTEDLPLLQWSCELALSKIQQALNGVLDNLPSRRAALILRALIFPLGPRLRPAPDHLGSTLARGMLDGNDMRIRLTRDIFVPDFAEQGLGQLEAALGQISASRVARRKIKDAVAGKLLEEAPILALLDRAVASGVLDPDEAQSLMMAAKAQDLAIQVDSFSPETYLALKC
jgi:acyl-CoA dehydrogenase